MSSYSIRDVERLLGLSRAIVQSFVDAGFIEPARGTRNAFLFSFQDLILLKAAQGLATVRIPTRRIKQALLRLRAELPPSLPLSGVRIVARGDQVVVQQGATQWQVDSGQYLLDLEEEAEQGAVAALRQPATLPVDNAQHWLARGAELEATDPPAAELAYRKAIELDPELLAAYVNLGCLLQAHADHAAAEAVYRSALEQAPYEALLYYNLGIALEDLARLDDAQHAYELSLKIDAQFADAHYNLARLHELRGHAQQAIQHMASYRRLMRG